VSKTYQKGRGPWPAMEPFRALHEMTATSALEEQRSEMYRHALIAVVTVFR
jgi:hypothetical protein